MYNSRFILLRYIALCLPLYGFNLSQISVGGHGGYNHNPDPVADFKNWMRQLADNATLTSLSIPGTHDTLSRCDLGTSCNSVAVLEPTTKTQSMPLMSQLHSGIRYIDVRIKHDNYNDDRQGFGIFHGMIYQGSRLKEDVLDIVKQFLVENYSETIIMRLKSENEHFDDDTVDELAAVLDSYKDVMLPDSCGISGDGLGFFVLGDGSQSCHARGKLIIQQDGYQLPHNVSFFYDQHPSGNTIQDNFHSSTNWDLANIKWPLVKSFMMKAHNGDASLLYINYLTMSVGAFPYFFASGQIRPANGTPRMSTGWVAKKSGENDPCWFDVPKKECKEKWPDFPRTHRVCVFLVGCYATISFEGIPTLTISYLNNNRQQYGPLRLGVMVADFPGGDFIVSVINSNYDRNGEILDIYSMIRTDQYLTKLPSVDETDLMQENNNANEQGNSNSNSNGPPMTVMKAMLLLLWNLMTSWTRYLQQTFFGKS